MELNKNITINEVLQKIDEKAEKLKNDAGYAGGYGDGGASKLKRDVEMFTAGMKFANDNIIPDEWKDYVYQILRNKDPEFNELQRLANKFGYALE